jgi:phosphohistidine phosphatase
MAQLWLLRHGDAEPHGTRDDADRRLTARGEDQARTAGAAIARLELGIDAVLTSPRVRALETARLACEAAGIARFQVHDPLSGGFDAHAASAVLAGRWADARVLLVGHEPDLSGLVRAFTGGTAAVKKGGLVGIEVDPDEGGTLRALLRPRDLQAIAER